MTTAHTDRLNVFVTPGHPQPATQQECQYAKDVAASNAPVGGPRAWVIFNKDGKPVTVKATKWEAHRFINDAIYEDKNAEAATWKVEPFNTSAQPLQRLTPEQINSIDQWLQDYPFWRVVAFVRAVVEEYERINGITGGRS